MSHRKIRTRPILVIDTLKIRKRIRKQAQGAGKKAANEGLERLSMVIPSPWASEIFSSNLYRVHWDLGWQVEKGFQRKEALDLSDALAHT